MVTTKLTPRVPRSHPANVSQSAPLRVPFDWLRPGDRFMPYTIKVECECHNCGNWWTPVGSKKRRFVVSSSQSP